MTIEYGNSPLTYSHRSLIEARAKGTLMTAPAYYQQTIVSAVFAALGVVSAFAAWTAYGSDWFLVIGIAMILHAAILFKGWKPHARWVHNAFNHPRISREQKRIRLEFADDGLREHQGDIVSFAPWRDVASALIVDDLLIIVLSSGQESIIPRESPGISTLNLNLEEIRAEVERRREQAKPAPTATDERTS